MNKLLCVATLLVLLFGFGMRPMNAQVYISTDKDSYLITEPVIVHVTIINPSNSSMKILKWCTPLEGIERPLFTVTRDGEPVTYLGPMVKRSAPTQTDYIILQPFERITSDVKLSDYYDLSAPGNYEIVYDAASWQLYGRNKIDHLISNILSIVVEVGG